MKTIVNFGISIAFALVANLSHADSFVHTVIVDGQAIKGPTERVVVIRDDETLPVSRGFQLELDDTLRTLENANVVVIRDPGAVEIYLSENTEIRISSIWLKLGEIYVRAKQELREAFEVKSEYGVAGVEGTEFIVRVGGAPGQNTPFSCLTLQGSVRMRSSDNVWDSVLVSAGSEFTLDRNDQPTVQSISENLLDLAEAPYKPLVEIHRFQPEFVKVPLAIGQLLEHTESLLERERLTLGDVTLVLTGAETGQVVGQKPAYGESVPPLTAMLLEVEGIPTTVPDLIGRSMSEATKLLDDTGLVTGTITPASRDERVEEKIIGQTPTAGTVVPEGTAIDLNISDGESARPKPPILIGSLDVL